MARFFPRHQRTNATRGERVVFERLRSLNDSWCVLHNLAYVDSGQARLRIGETDFVLLHPRHGLLIMEVKDGGYRVTDRQWFASRRGADVPLGDPFDQAVRNRYALANWLRRSTGIRQVPAGHCVVFTDGRPSGNLGPHAPDTIVLTAASLEHAPVLVERVMAHWDQRGWTSRSDFEQALAALAPSAVVARTLRYDVDLAADDLDRLTRRQIQLTGRQLEVLAGTSRRPASLVLGAAGTGKTLLAQERARELAARGLRVAVIGQQRDLRLEIRRQLRVPGVSSGDPQDVLCDLFGADRIGGYEGEPLWATVLSLVEAYGRPLDCLIVDEAQSHDEDLLVALRELVRPDGSVVLFADPYQRDRSGTWRPDGAFNEFWLTENCRNTLPIAKLVARVSGAHTPFTGPDGRRPRFTDGTADLVGACVDAVVEIVKDLATSQAVLVTATQGSHAAIRRALAGQGVRVSPGLRGDGLAVCTVRQFHGCEAPAVVYADDGDEDWTTSYIAVSRACAFLHVVGGHDRWEPFRFLMEDDR
ncbi:NERD domain-containing protein [Micromonospora aurantiaca]|uniref:NERD nuclease n=1 Tax=Micromonospora aurantiaca (nom. illeg.) TaxID=47850 RepID=A0A1C6T1G1_9ACTN|nr:MULTISPECIES: NERD domain-containing protein [Micromonospora]ADU06881.1 NERD domain protein [Micromonospora sp. L5]AXH90848.1 NERD nuclease [Micromonospora aurantiaca]MBC9000906.1 NERD domain-containing protein [Micromonospora aurantiaca]OHX04011.1 NERD nuclease [Micromonospora sp. WMMB235]RNI00235.1 NERD nuclease [Micromonospora aurantiaca]